jgi:hypothetical protein
MSEDLPIFQTGMDLSDRVMLRAQQGHMRHMPVELVGKFEFLLMLH